MHYETDFRSVYAKVIDSWLGGDSVSVLGGEFPQRQRRRILLKRIKVEGKGKGRR